MSNKDQPHVGVETKSKPQVDTIKMSLITCGENLIIPYFYMDLFLFC